MGSTVLPWARACCIRTAGHREGGSACEDSGPGQPLLSMEGLPLSGSCPGHKIRVIFQGLGSEVSLGAECCWEVAQADTLTGVCPPQPELRLPGPSQAIEPTQGLEATRPGQDHAHRPVGGGELGLGTSRSKDHVGNPHSWPSVPQHQPWELPSCWGLVSLWKGG